MPDRSRQKERQRHKREQKRQQHRRMEGVSPYRRFGQQGEIVACHVNADWRERGQAAGNVLRRGPGGKLGMATFFVDTWCAGLKDIWGRLDLMREEYDDVLDRMSAQMDDTIRSCEIAELNAILAGGIRFARQNGFRLPAHYERWAVFFGEIDPTSADLTHFGYESDKLHWVGPIEDLRKRYIGGRVDDFLSRADVHFTFGIPEDEMMWEDDDDDDDDDDDAYDDEDTNDAFDEEGSIMADAFRESATHLADGVRRWCFSSGITPSPQLEMASAMSMMITASTLLEANQAEDERMSGKRWQEQMESAIAQLPREQQDELFRAQQQVQQFMEQFESPEKMLKAIGMDEDNDDDDDDDDA